MLQTTEFFQEQIKQCRASAARSHNKGDHDFWLKMAHRWEALLQIRQPDRSGRYRFRLHNLRFEKRRRAAYLVSRSGSFAIIAAIRRASSVCTPSAVPISPT